MLLISDLSFFRNENKIFENINFSLNKKQIIQIKGKNGSGKTTFLHVILNILEQKSGEVFWEGPERAGRYATFLAFKGYVMVLFGEGELQVIVASPDGYQKAASWMISEEYTWAAPVLLKNGILIKDQGHLTLWSF